MVAENPHKSHRVRFPSMFIERSNSLYHFQFPATMIIECSHVSHHIYCQSMRRLSLNTYVPFVRNDPADPRLPRAFEAFRDDYVRAVPACRHPQVHNYRPDSGASRLLKVGAPSHRQIFGAHPVIKFPPIEVPASVTLDAIPHQPSRPIALARTEERIR
jgi:hypothetical protein